MRFYLIVFLFISQNVFAAEPLCLRTRTACNQENQIDISNPLDNRFRLSYEDLDKIYKPEAPAISQEAKKYLKSRFKWWQMTLAGLGMAIPEFFLNTFIHEGAHALVAMSFGNKIVEFQPYPHMKDGQFFFGRMRRQGNLTAEEDLWVSAAPMLTDAVMISLLFGISIGGKFPKNQMAAMAMLVFSAGFVVDLINHVQSTNPSSDIMKLEKRLSQATGWSSRTSTVFIRTLHGVFIAGGLVLLIKEGIKIFRGTAGYTRTKKVSRWRQKLRKYQLEAAPMVDSSSIGLSIGGRF